MAEDFCCDLQGFNTKGYSPAHDVMLCWDTFTAAANQAGLSRLIGGIHTESDNVDGLALGHAVGNNVYKAVSKLWQGAQD